MWVSKVSEVIGSSPHGFEDAARAVLERANHTLRGVHGLEVIEKSVKVEDGDILEYRVRLRLVFDVVPPVDPHW